MIEAVAAARTLHGRALRGPARRESLPWRGVMGPLYASVGGHTRVWRTGLKRDALLALYSRCPD